MGDTFAVTGTQPGPDQQDVAFSVCKVLICDEWSVTGRALSNALRAGPSPAQIRWVMDGFALVDAFAAELADLVMLGYRVGLPGGPQAADLLLSLFPSAPVIAVGSADARTLLVAAVARGARGLMIWNPGGGDPLPSPGGPPGVGPFHQVRLSNRELQVLRGMAEGRSNQEIARELFLSEDTIKTHARKLYDKLGARDRAHAVALGMRNNHLT